MKYKNLTDDQKLLVKSGYCITCETRASALGSFRCALCNEENLLPKPKETLISPIICGYKDDK